MHAASRTTTTTCGTCTAPPHASPKCENGAFECDAGYELVDTVCLESAKRNTWVTVADMSSIPRDLAAAAGADGRIYALGGYDGSNTLDTVEAYGRGVHPVSIQTLRAMPSFDEGSTSGSARASSS